MKRATTSLQGVEIVLKSTKWTSMWVANFIMHFLTIMRRNG